MAMQANAMQVENTQLGLYDGVAPPRRVPQSPVMVRPAGNRAPVKGAPVTGALAKGALAKGTLAKGTVTLCAGCRAKEARYGFREDEGEERPRTLCFQCFRMELDWRRRVAAQLARGWNAEQERLPLAATLKALTARRRRAQIAARHALGADVPATFEAECS